LKKTIIIILLLLLSFVALGSENNENDITFKASFIIDLLDKIEWPDNAQAADSQPLIISILGQSSLTPKIEELAAEKSARGVKIIVQTIAMRDDISDTKILFSPTKNLKELARILNKVEGTRVVTVSDCDEFARYGVMFNFYKEEGQKEVKFELNRMVIDFAGLKVDPDLFKKARII